MNQKEDFSSKTANRTDIQGKPRTANVGKPQTAHKKRSQNRKPHLKPHFKGPQTAKFLHETFSVRENRKNGTKSSLNREMTPPGMRPKRKIYVPVTRPTQSFSYHYWPTQNFFLASSSNFLKFWTFHTTQDKFLMCMPSVSSVMGNVNTRCVDLRGLTINS